MSIIISRQYRNERLITNGQFMKRRHSNVTVVYLGRLRVLLLRLQFVVVLCRVVLLKSELTLRAVTQIGDAGFETLGPGPQFLSST